MNIAITGTTSGIGLALKTEFENKHSVTSINRDTVELSDLASLAQVNLSGMDVLINNAGHGRGGASPFVSHQVSDWTNIIDTNLKAAVFLTQRFIQQNSSGTVIFITSKILEKNIGGDCVYATSKSALHTFIECLRDELKDSEFRLVEIRPGRVRTRFAENRQIHSEDTIQDFYNHRRHMSTDSVVSAVEYALNNTCVETVSLS